MQASKQSERGSRMKLSGWWRALLGLSCVLALFTSAQAQGRYDLSTWVEDLKATRWESGAVFAGVTAQGIRSWNWGSQSFHSQSERWFGQDTSSGGADKLGHAFTSYALVNVLADRLVRQGRSPQQAALSAALTSQAIMLYVEVFDGFSKDHGFAREDVAMNLLGAGLGYARTVNPKLRDLMDFRMEYESSGYKGFRPFSDYSGQKYLVALKLGGMEALRDTPLRFLELQAGYYTRGFSKAEQDAGLNRSRHTFVGVGLNVGELLFGRRTNQESELKNASRLFFEHIQLPHTAARTSREF
jgi:hypothetical protein